MRNVWKRYRFREWKQKIREQLFHFREPAYVKALSVGVGLAIGFSPFWGFQTLTAIGLAVLLRLNKVLTITFSYISLPPLIPLVIYLQWMTGNLVTGGGAVPYPVTLETVREGSLQYLIGSGVLAIMAGLTGAGITYLLLHMKNRRKRKNQRTVSVSEVSRASSSPCNSLSSTSTSS